MGKLGIGFVDACWIVNTQFTKPWRELRRTGLMAIDDIDEARTKKTRAQKPARNETTCSR